MLWIFNSKKAIKLEVQKSFSDQVLVVTLYSEGELRNTAQSLQGQFPVTVAIKEHNMQEITEKY